MISPGYRPHKATACNPAQLFYDKIYGVPEWKTINELCNRTKHLKQVSAKETVGYDLPFNQWPNVSSVVNFSKGPPTGFSVDGRDIVDIMEVVIAFYQNEWFRSPDVGIFRPNGSPPPR